MSETAWGPPASPRSESGRLKLVEMQLQECERRFAILSARLQDHAIFSMDPKGHITWWGDGARRLTGYTQDEVQGQAFTLLFTPEDRRLGLPERELQTATNMGSAADENWSVRKDGSQFWASGYSEAQRNPDGTLRGFIKVFRDLTERQQTNAALCESELRLRAALGAADMGTWLWQVLTDKQTLDENLHRLMEVPEGRSVHTLEDFLGFIHADDRAAVHAAFLLAAREGSGLLVEFRIPRPDGTTRWLRDRGEVVRDAAGQALYLTGACVDITDQKHLEATLRRANVEMGKTVEDRSRNLRMTAERMAAIVQSAGEGIVTFNEQGIIDSFNPAAQKMFGYELLEVLNKSVLMLVPSCIAHNGYPPGREDITALMGPVPGGLQGVVGQKKDGSTFPLHVTLSEVKTVSSRLFIGMFHDVSEQRALEREVLEIEADERRRIGLELHDTIAQELVAATILGEVLITNLPPGTPEANYASKMVGYLGQTRDHVRRISHGLVPVVIEADGLMTALTELTQKTAYIHKVECRFDCPEPVLVGDNTVATHLYRIAQEAVANSLRHGQADQIVISLRTENNVDVLTVRDDGSGISSEPKPDRGIGLKIMRHRANMIGASLQIDTTEGKGTIITCSMAHTDRT